MDVNDLMLLMLLMLLALLELLVLLMEVPRCRRHDWWDSTVARELLLAGTADVLRAFSADLRPNHACPTELSSSLSLDDHRLTSGLRGVGGVAATRRA
jgi:hypothetical protein